MSLGFLGVSGSPVLGKGIFLKRLSDCQVPELLLQKAKGDVRTYQSLLAASRETRSANQRVL